jgi:hypothetical protein
MEGGHKGREKQEEGTEKCEGEGRKSIGVVRTFQALKKHL